MKPISLMAITALALSGVAVAQTQGYSSSSSTSNTSTTTTTQTQTQTQTQTPPASSTSPSGSPSGSSTMSGSSSGTSASPTTSSATATQEAPAPRVVEQKIDLTDNPGPPADTRAARTEAINALAWAKREGCRDDPSPRDCVHRAQDEYRETMARLGPGPTDSHRSGTMSASGTSEAGAPRADRN